MPALIQYNDYYYNYIIYIIVLYSIIINGDWQLQWNFDIMNLYIMNWSPL